MAEIPMPTPEDVERALREATSMPPGAGFGFTIYRGENGLVVNATGAAAGVYD